MNSTSMALIDCDLQHHFHPCAQMKDYLDFPPLVIKRAQGCYLELEGGQRVIDATSSWWCKSLGHGHPRIKKALKQQLKLFEHVLAAHTCQKPLVELSQALAQFIPNLNKVFYASDGSTAVEIALKMSLHAHQLKGEFKRKEFMALQNDYHGETLLALSVSDLGLYRSPYESILTPVTFIQNVPYVNSTDDPLWHNCAESWPSIEAQLNAKADTLSALIIEPLIQGAAGMKIYSQDLLKRLRHWTTQKGIHFIVDEIMTGLGRLGHPLACQWIGIEPDFICLSKGLTAGFLPMSAVLIHADIYQLFYSDYPLGKSFLHSNTFSGNALSAAVANECLKILVEDKIYSQVQQLSPVLLQEMQRVAEKSQRLKNVRGIGFVVAADFILESCEENKRFGFQLAIEAARLGVLIRPLGNTLYWLPPLISTRSLFKTLSEITLRALELTILKLG